MDSSTLGMVRGLGSQRWSLRRAGLALLAALAVGSCAPQPARAPTPAATPSELLPTGLRRLTNREFVRSLQALLDSEPGELPAWHVPLDVEQRLPPDVRQEDGYTRNVEQTMSAALAVNVAEIAHRLATDALVTRRQQLYFCGNTRNLPGPVPCSHRFIRQIAERGFRRDVTDDEMTELVHLFARATALSSEPSTGQDAGESASTPVGPQLRGEELGVVAVLSAVIQSPNFWYVSEQGPLAGSNALRPAPHVVTLTQDEVATQIAFTLRGTPPDAELRAAAGANELFDPEVRVAQAWRLLSQPDSREHYRQFVLQWLEVDNLSQTAKSEAIFEQYEAFKPLMVTETERFADEVFVSRGASMRSMLTANFTAVDPKLAVFYGLDRFGPRVSLAGTERLGVLQQASFLAAHSHADATSPVLRGDFVLRKVLCERLPRPGELQIEVIMPRPSETQTRREQFLRHGADPKCASCHDQIDGFGLAMENFDAAGRARTTELNQPVRTDGRVLYAGQTHDFSDSLQLSAWLAEQPEAAECFARQAFRFVTGRKTAEPEAAFLRLRDTLPPDKRDNLLEHLVAYVSSDAFIHRRSP